ncbi:hypothetical protein GQ600_10539 [Phytophthora cactorum]|nr:hypothetical protein GQ600_10539 [Phytophthora cactorum]
MKSTYLCSGVAHYTSSASRLSARFVKRKRSAARNGPSHPPGYHAGNGLLSASTAHTRNINAYRSSRCGDHVSCTGGTVSPFAWGNRSFYEPNAGQFRSLVDRSQALHERLYLLQLLLVGLQETSDGQIEPMACTADKRYAHQPGKPFVYRIVITYQKHDPLKAAGSGGHRSGRSTRAPQASARCRESIRPESLRIAPQARRRCFAQPLWCVLHSSVLVSLHTGTNPFCNLHTLQPIYLRATACPTLVATPRSTSKFTPEQIACFYFKPFITETGTPPAYRSASQRQDAKACTQIWVHQSGVPRAV